MMLGEATARITLDIGDMMRNAGLAENRMVGLDGAIGRGTSGMQRFRDVALGIGTALVVPMGIGLNAAMDLEQAIQNVNASLGGLPQGQLDALTAEMQRVGTASQFSATQVAGVADELARAGFSFEEIVGGRMTQAVVDLSQATGADLMTSVSGVTSVMNLWNAEIVGTEHAISSATQAADIFTIAANESSAEVGDIIAGVRNLGPGMTAIGGTFEETAAAIALFTNNGMKAADSGISMQRAIENLNNPTAEAQALMNELGITAFDLNGNFVGLPALFDQLHTSMADMSPQARQMALSTIFGAEAMDVMTLAVLQGGDPLRALIALMDESGVAAEQSAMRMDTLRGQWETLKEGVTTFLGSLVQGLIPGLRLGVDGANMFVDALMRIPGPIKTIIGAIAGGLAAFAAFNIALQTSRAASALLGISFAGMGTSLMGLLPIIGLIAAAAGVLYLAWRTNFLGIRDLTDSVGVAFDKFRSIWNNLADSAANNAFSRGLIALSQALQTFDIGWLDDLGRKLNGVAQGVNAFFDVFGGAESTKTVTMDVEFNGDEHVLEWQNMEDGTTKYAIMHVEEDGSLTEFGTIIESYDDENDPNIAHIKVRGEDGEFWTTIEKDTGVIGDATIEVKTDQKALKETRSNIDRITGGLRNMERELRRQNLDFFADLVDMAADGVEGFDRLTGQFRSFRALGMDPVEAGIMALGAAFPQLRGVTVELYGAWQSLIAIGQNVYGAIESIIDVVGMLRDAFAQGGWTAVWDVIAQGFQSIDWQGMALTAGLSILQGFQSVVTSVDRVIELAWTAITALNWSEFVPGLSWVSYVNYLFWESYVGALVWELYITSVVWADYIAELAWSSFVVGVILTEYVADLAWDLFVVGVILADYVPSLFWSLYITGVVLGEYVDDVAWDLYLTSVVWADYIAEVSWDAYITSVVLADYVAELTWSTFITAVILADKVADLAWDTYVVGVVLTDYVSDLAWSAFITPIILADKVADLAWSSYVVAVTLADYVSDLAWSAFITPVILADKVADVVWSTFITGVDFISDGMVTVLLWSSFVSNLSWSSFVPDINWSSFIPNLEWPSPGDILSAIAGAIPGIGGGDDGDGSGASDTTGDPRSGYTKGGYGGSSPSLLGGNFDFLALGDAVGLALDGVTALIQEKSAEWAIAMQEGIDPLSEIAWTGFGTVNTAADSNMAAASAAVGLHSGAILATSTANFGAMTAGAITNFTATNTTGSTNTAQLAANVGTNTGVMAAQALGSFGRMAGGAIAETTRMRIGTVSEAGAAAGGIVNELVSGGARAVAGFGGQMGRLAGVVTSSGGAAIGAASALGSNVGGALADALDAMYGRVSAAAGRLAGAAAAAMALALEVQSPSRFAIWLAEMVGEGLIIGFDRMTGRVGRSALDLAGTITDSLTPNIRSIDLGLKGVYNDAARMLGREMGALGGAVIQGWEMLTNGFWRDVETGLIRKGILAEDGGYVNPSFYGAARPTTSVNNLIDRLSFIVTDELIGAVRRSVPGAPAAAYASQPASGATYNTYHYAYTVQEGAIAVHDSGDPQRTADVVIDRLNDAWVSTGRIG